MATWETKGYVLKCAVSEQESPPFIDALPTHLPEVPLLLVQHVQDLQPVRRPLRVGLQLQ